MASEFIQPESVHSTVGVGYSHVAKAGDAAYIAGQIALDTEGNLVGQGDVGAQTHQVYTNLQAILEELGGSLTDIVKLTTYLTDRRHLDALRSVRNSFFSDPFPPNTLLFVSGLAQPDYLVEIEAVAYLPSS